jgi:hypothetical protein
MDLLNEYGPLGQTIYDVILCMVYREGYYLAIPKEKLAIQIMRIIGNRWVTTKDLVLQVIQYCSDIGLLCVDLLQQNVITSVGIQKRYAEVTVRNKVQKNEYWLLDNSGSLAIAVTETPVIVTETPVIVTETPVIVTETPVIVTETPTKEKKTKSNKRKGNEGKPSRTFVPPHLEDVIAYCRERKNNVNPHKFFDYFNTSNWVDSRGNKVTNWKLKIITWENHNVSAPPNDYHRVNGQYSYGGETGGDKDGDSL